eukprot:TRINITY_DN7504_c0_g1_i1.p1 TRINITY_DN7504_c0_g1~~TRINITY_DN7504_c0_g1_i1.p1  ORF type:complete len:283 (+),score=40.10 TRINITY_DN7504_c0_g1_i1:137-985(+)
MEATVGDVFEFGVICDQTVDGDSVYVVGDWCYWDVANAVELKTSESTWPRWTGAIERKRISSDLTVYKYFVKSRDGVARWEILPPYVVNRTRLTATQQRDRIDVFHRITVADVLELILTAQDGGFATTRTLRLPPYKTALMEISSGQKRSHWIWYVWPSLCEIRTQIHTQFLLPSFESSLSYIEQPKLRNRLLEISRVAAEVLESGTTPEALMGAQAGFDVPKLHECMTCFYYAAEAKEDRELMEVCKRVVDVLNRGGFHTAVQLLAERWRRTSGASMNDQK